MTDNINVEEKDFSEYDEVPDSVLLKILDNEISSIDRIVLMNQKGTSKKIWITLSNGDKVVYSYTVGADGYSELSSKLADSSVVEEPYVKGQEEIDKEIEQKKLSVRRIRDSLLTKTDFCVLTDSPFSTEQKREIKTYRQELRDVPEQEGFPENVSWPTPPQFLKLC